MRALLVFAERDEDSGTLFEQLYTNAVWKNLHLLICSKKTFDGIHPNQVSQH
jgi:hypothetical protein